MVSSVADLGEIYNEGTGVVTLTADAKWALTADITIKKLDLAGHSLTITTKDWTAGVIKHKVTVQNDVLTNVIDAGTSASGVVLEVKNADFVLNDTSSGTRAENAILTLNTLFYLKANNADIDLNVGTGKSIIQTGDSKTGKGTVFDLKASTLDIVSDAGIQSAYFKLNASDLSFTHKTETATQPGSLGGYFELSNGSTVNSDKTFLYAAFVEKGSTFDAGTLSMAGSSADISGYWMNISSSMKMNSLDIDGTMSIAGTPTVTDIAVSGTLNIAGALTISGVMTVDSGASVNGGENATITNNDMIFNNGTITMTKTEGSYIVGTGAKFIAGANSIATFPNNTSVDSVSGTGKVTGYTPGDSAKNADLSGETSVDTALVNNYLKAGMDVTLPSSGLTIVEKEEIVVVSGSSIDGTVTAGGASSDTVTFDTVTFTGVTGDFTVFSGNSVNVRGNITGGTINVTAGAVEIISGKVVEDTTIIADAGATVKFSDVTVNSGVKLTLAGEGEFNVVSDKSFNLYGSLAAGLKADGKPYSIDVDVNATADGKTKASFKAYSGSQIAGTILIAGNGTIDLTQAQNPQTVGEDISYDKLYGQLENVTIIDSLTIKNNSTVTVMGGFNVNEGVTLTIEKGSKLYINSAAASMIVDGRIIVEEGATLEVAKAKDVKVSGSIESDGIVSIASTVTIKSGGSIVINDNSTTTTSGSTTTTVYNSKFRATQGLTVESGAELIIKSLVGYQLGEETAADLLKTQVTNKGTVTLDGAVLGGDFTVNMAANEAVVQVLSVSGNHNVTITDEGLVFANKTPVEIANANTVIIAVGDDIVKGLTVVETVSSKTTATGVEYYNTLDLAGAVSLSKESGDVAFDVDQIKVSGQRIAVTGELTLGKYVGLTLNGKMSVSGKLVAIEDKSKVTHTGDAENLTVTGLVQTVDEIDKISAAMYETKSGTTTLYNYTTLKAAIDSGAKDIVVTGTVYVTESLTVPTGTTVKNENGTIIVGSDGNTDVELIFADGAVLKSGIVDVKGTLYFENNKNSNKASDIKSDVSVIGEKDARYTNVYTALAKANAGETVTITGEKVLLEKNITIKEGVTLDVPNSKKLVVYAGVTITVNGTLKTAEKIETAKYTTTAGVEEYVTFALAADKLNGKAAIIVNGVFMSMAAVDYNTDVKYMIPGAYYSLIDDAGAYNYVTTLENASKTAATPVTVYGKVSAGDVVFTGTDSAPRSVVVANDADSDLTVASITLDKTTFTVNATGKFTGDVKAGDAAVSVKLVNGMVVSVDKDGLFTVKGATAADAKSSSFKVSAGSVYIETASMNVTVTAGATLVSAAAQSTITGKLTIEGTVTVANEQTISVTDDVTVKGALSVADATDSKIAGTFNAEKNLYIGLTPKDVTGDAASVSGAVSEVQVAFVKADANVSDATIESFKVDGVLKSTTYVVEGKDWMTVYDRTGNYYIGKVTEAPFENAEFKANKWLSTDGESADKKVIGASKCDKVTANIEYKIYTIQITPCAGVESIAIDGNLIGDYNYGDYSSVKVKAGSHTVTYSLANGYSGEAKLSLVESGDKTTASVSGQTFTVSGEKGVVKLQLTGVEKSGYVDPVVPEQKDDDDGMSLTDILLIVLVVLIVIMAVIVAMRLMRS